MLMSSTILVNQSVLSLQAGDKFTSITQGRSCSSRIKSKPYTSKVFGLCSIDSWTPLRVAYTTWWIAGRRLAFHENSQCSGTDCLTYSSNWSWDITRSSFENCLFPFWIEKFDRWLYWSARFRKLKSLPQIFLYYLVTLILTSTLLRIHIYRVVPKTLQAPIIEYQISSNSATMASQCISERFLIRFSSQVVLYPWFYWYNILQDPLHYMMAWRPKRLRIHLLSNTEAIVWIAFDASLRP